MKKKIERIIAYILVMAMVIGLFPVPMTSVRAENEDAPATATDATSEDESQYYDSDNSLTDKASESIEDENEVSSDLEDSTQEETQEETQIEPQDVAFSATKECDGFTIKVEADPGVFPEGSSFSVKKVSDTLAEAEGVYDAVEEKRSDDVNVAESMTFDIKVLDKNGQEIEPDNSKGEVKVSFSNNLVADSNLDTDVYHIKDRAGAKEAEKLDTDEKGNIAEVTTDGFSYYTVEFTYDGLQYVMEGDTALPLSTILDFVGLTGTVEDAYGSNDELFCVMKAVQEGREWVESEDGEWIVKAEKAFSSNETLTVTINGVEYVIDVTDAQYDTNYNKEAKDLVNAVLGDGLSATNCSRTGTINTFTGGESDIGFASGIILSSAGNVSGGTDPDLAALVAANGQKYGNGTQANTSTLEFTLTATGTLLNFNYVFASNEFNQGPTYNDAFGLFVSVNGGAYENIALIERTNGTLVPVTINNLRAGISGTEMSNGQSTSLGGSHSLFYEKNISINSGSTNGVSIVFNAQKVVHKGDIVKIKFAICNVGDNSVPSYVMIQASSLKFDTPGAKPNYLTEYLWDIEPNTTYEIEEDGVKYNLTTDSEGKVPLAGKDNNNKSYDFIGKTISITMLDSSGEVASETQDLGIAERPPAPDDPDAPEIDIAEKPADVHDIEIETTDTTITVHGPQENEYKLDEGPWTKPTNGVVVFDNLTPNHEYTVYTRVAATENHPYGETSEGEHIRTNAVDLEINIMNYQGVYDGAYHGASVTTPVQGAEITWSDEFHTNYSETKPTFKDVGTYTVYYRVVKENCYPAYGALTVTITGAPVTVKADDKNKVRGEQDPSLTATVTGLVNGESESLITYTLSRASGENAGTYTITPTGSKDQGNYTVTYKTGTFTIAASANHGSVSMDGWIYGKTAMNPSVTSDYGANTATFEYFTDVACLTKTSTADGASAAGGKPSNAGIYYVVATIPATTNYQGVITTPAEFTISKAQITITAIDKTSVYGDSLATFTNSVTGDYKTGDDLGIVLSSQVTTTPVVGEYPITISWNQNPNYTATLVPGTYTVTKRPITVIPEAKSKIYGETDPELTFVLKSGSSYAPGDDINIFSGKLIRVEGENVGSYLISQGTLAVNDNYQLTFENSTDVSLTIARKLIHVVANDRTKIYGEEDPALTYTVTGLEEGDILTGSLARGNQENVGVYVDSIVQGTLTNANNKNYDIEFTPATFSITKRVIVISIDNKSKVYGQDDPELTFTINPLTPLVRNDDKTTAFTGSLERANSTVQNVGEYDITIGTLKSSNYEIFVTNGKLTITKKPITIKAIDKVQVYGDAEIPLTYELDEGSSMAYGEDIYKVAEGNIAREIGQDVGEYAIIQNTLLSPNYDISFIEGIYEITKRPITINADNQTKVYGDEDPELTYVLNALTSLAYDETIEEIVTGEPEREEGIDVGEYVISQGTIDSSNYDITFVNGTLEITKRPIIIIAEDKEKSYGEEDPKLTYINSEKTPLYESDRLLDAVNVKLVREEGETFGDYAIKAEKIDSKNYDVTFKEGKFVINKVESGAEVGVISEDESDNNVKVTTSNEDLLNMLLSDEDRAMVIAGAGIRVYFEVTHLDQVVQDESTSIQNALPEGYVVGDNYDISLYKKYSFKPEPEQLFETPQEVSFELDENLPDIPDGATREYVLVRVHNGEAQIIDSEYDSEKNVVRFKTDKFSTYTLAYKDSMSQEDTKHDLSSVMTGDSMNMSLLLLLMTLSIFGMANVIYRKKKETIK